MNHFMKRLSELMKAESVSQNKLAQALHVKQQTISRYVNGTREPDIATIKKLCDFFDVSAGYLLGFEE